MVGSRRMPARLTRGAMLGTAMPIQDRAKNVLECVLGRGELRGAPLVFACHSLGGLVVKQVLRAADGRRAYSAETQVFLDSVKGVVFIATPHTGSMQATLLDKLRLIAWPSCIHARPREEQRQSARTSTFGIATGQALFATKSSMKSKGPRPVSSSIAVILDYCT